MTTGAESPGEEGEHASPGSLDDPEGWPIHWMTRVQRLTARLSRATTGAETSGLVVEQARQALDADGGVVFLRSADGATVEVAHASGYPPQLVSLWATFPLGLSAPPSDAIRDGLMILVCSREEMQERYPALVASNRLADHSAWAIVPLMTPDRCIGALGLSFGERRGFSSDEVGFLRVVADQCAQSLHRALLVDRERRSTARLRTLAQASRGLSAIALDVPGVIDEVARQVVANLGPACTVALVSRDGASLEVAAIRDLDPAAEAQSRQVAGGLRVRRGEGLAGQVLESGQSLFMPVVLAGELGQRTVTGGAEQVEALQVRSLLIVPLKAAGRVIGTISTSRRADHAPFTEEDRALLEDLADRSALAIENARLHQAEREARARAEEADRRKDQFLAMLGHELRNSLAPIRMGLEITRELPADDEGVTWAREMIGRQVDQLARLLDDLLDVSRLDLGRVDLYLEPLDLVALASRALEASRPLLNERQHTVSLVVPAEPVLVRADLVRLTQVISNLLGNAGRYTDPGGKVSLTVTATAAEATIVVADSGIGIPADMLDRVFEPFIQLDNAGERARGGLGIGLTLVKRLVQMHGGTVQARSDGPNQGSELVVRLARLDVAEVAPSTQAAIEPIRPAVRRILVADDNRDVAESLRRMLVLQGHQVAVVHDGLEVERTARLLAPDIILLDIYLPGADGLEVARRLREIYGSGPGRPLLVAMTGLGQEEDRARSAAAGFDHHLVKPIDLESLYRVLTEPGQRPESAAAP
jgi:signal transduction histidine kinase/ActR/RegA family two-component response regulator